MDPFGVLKPVPRSGSARTQLTGGNDAKKGTIAARLLVELGTNPATAIAKVRNARPGAIETTTKGDFVRSLRPSW